MRVVPLIFLTVFLSFCLFAIYTNPKSALALASSVKTSLAKACGLKERVSSTLRIYTIRRPSGVRLMFSRFSPRRFTSQGTTAPQVRGQAIAMCDFCSTFALKTKEGTEKFPLFNA